ncbi:MAG: hypothetical protein AB7Q37_18780 [Pyrinomonadaceae bacterium]
MAFIKKITVKNVCGGDLKSLLPKEGGARTIARIFGVASGKTDGVSHFGGEPSPWVKFSGQFQGINTVTGEEFKSFTCLLPELGANLLGLALESSDGSPVEFGFDIAISGTDTPIGYQFEVTPLVELKIADLLGGLLARVSETAPLRIGNADMPQLPLSDSMEGDTRPAVRGKNRAPQNAA